MGKLCGSLSSLFFINLSLEFKIKISVNIQHFVIWNFISLLCVFVCVCVCLCGLGVFFVWMYKCRDVEYDSFGHERTI